MQYKDFVKQEMAKMKEDLEHKQEVLLNEKIQKVTDHFEAKMQDYEAKHGQTFQ